MYCQLQISPFLSLQTGEKRWLRLSLPRSCCSCAQSSLGLHSCLALVAPFFPPSQDFWQELLFGAGFVTGWLGSSLLAEALDAELIIREITQS